MKSLPFGLPSLESLVKRLLKLSFELPIFRRFFFSFSSSRTRAVSIAVAAFLIPFPELGVGVDVLLRLVGLACDAVGWNSRAVSDSTAAGAESPLACFLRFLEPGAFFNECVRPWSASLCARPSNRCLSSSFCGRIVMTLSSE